MANTIYTIGHSQHSLDVFLGLLKKYDINYVLDVRSTPYSQFASDYNREMINRYLEMNDIRYSFMGKYFGARQEDSTLYAPEGYLDFKKVRQSDLFKRSFENVMQGIKSGYHISLMCTEKDPIDCHRTIMVAKAFHENDVTVKHIMPDGNLQTQKDIENRLLQMYFPDRMQISLFDENNKSDEEYIELAYVQQNKKIGYHKKSAAM